MIRRVFYSLKEYLALKPQAETDSGSKGRGGSAWGRMYCFGLGKKVERFG